MPGGEGDGGSAGAVEGVDRGRGLAGGHMGQGLHLSEIISDVVEPMVGLMKRGREVISTEDLLAKIEKLNKSMSDWTPLSWWEGKESNGYISCGTCVGETEYNFDENNPEMCCCAQQARNNDGEAATTSKVVPMGGVSTTEPMGEEVTTSSELVEEVTREQMVDRSSNKKDAH